MIGEENRSALRNEILAERRKLELERKAIRQETTKDLEGKNEPIENYKIEDYTQVVQNYPVR